MHSLAERPAIETALIAAEKLGREGRNQLGPKPGRWRVLRYGLATAPRLIAIVEEHNVTLAQLPWVLDRLLRGLFDGKVPGAAAARPPSSPTTAPQVFLDLNLRADFSAAKREDGKVVVSCRRCTWTHVASDEADVHRPRSRMALGDHRRTHEGANR